mmetsp:Transcript_7208/g.10545  ORF Transcript_7208/g.10545 Transcript_7208/m.10545 type:complete len:81 (+) Transcript_7208:53-295(+)
MHIFNAEVKVNKRQHTNGFHFHTQFWKKPSFPSNDASSTSSVSFIISMADWYLPLTISSINKPGLCFPVKAPTILCSLSL